MNNVLDLLKARGGEPKLAASGRSGGEYWSACPGCGGTDRFHVWTETNNGSGSYWCRQCGKKGDRIQFMMDFDGKSFPEACKVLGIKLQERDKQAPVYHRASERRPRENKPPAYQPRETLEPAELWQTKAAAFVEYCHGKLLENKEQLSYLNGRGINLETVKKFQLGWNPGETEKGTFRPRPSWGVENTYHPNGKAKKLWLPRGIVIPYIVDGQVRRLRVRRPDVKEKKYIVIPGSASEPFYIPARAKLPGPGYIVVEAELDGIAIHQAAGDLIDVVSPGNTTVRPDAALYQKLKEALVVLVSMDMEVKADGSSPGVEASRWWVEQFDTAEIWPARRGKDPGEDAELGEDLRVWVQAGLPPLWRVGPSLLTGDEEGGGGFKAAEVDEGAVVERKEPGPVDGTPENIKALYGMLRQYPGVKIRAEARRCTLTIPPGCKDSREISRLVFSDVQVLDFLTTHPAGQITWRNFWE